MKLHNITITVYPIYLICTSVVFDSLIEQKILNNLLFLQGGKSLRIGRNESTYKKYIFQTKQNETAKN